MYCFAINIDGHYLYGNGLSDKAVKGLIQSQKEENAKNKK